MFLFALAIYAAFLSLYIAFIWVIVFHMRKYGTRDENHSKAIKTFAVIIISLLILSFVAFIRVPWNNFTL